MISENKDPPVIKLKKINSHSIQRKDAQPLAKTSQKSSAIGIFRSLGDKGSDCHPSLISCEQQNILEIRNQILSSSLQRDTIVALQKLYQQYPIHLENTGGE
jgi:hypothetical protein